MLHLLIVLMLGVLPINSSTKIYTEQEEKVLQEKRETVTSPEYHEFALSLLKEKFSKSKSSHDKFLFAAAIADQDILLLHFDDAEKILTKIMADSKLTSSEIEFCKLIELQGYSQHLRYVKDDVEYHSLYQTADSLAKKDIVECRDPELTNLLNRANLEIEKTKEPGCVFDSRGKLLSYEIRLQKFGNASSEEKNRQTRIKSAAASAPASTPTAFSRPAQSTFAPASTGSVSINSTSGAAVITMMNPGYSGDAHGFPFPGTKPVGAAPKQVTGTNSMSCGSSCGAGCGAALPTSKPAGSQLAGCGCSATPLPDPKPGAAKPNPFAPAKVIGVPPVIHSASQPRSGPMENTNSMSCGSGCGAGCGAAPAPDSKPAGSQSADCGCSATPLPDPKPGAAKPNPFAPAKVIGTPPIIHSTKSQPRSGPMEDTNSMSCGSSCGAGCGEAPAQASKPVASQPAACGCGCK